MEEKLVIIKTAAGMNDLIKYLKDKDYITFDTETDGVDKESRVIGFSVCSEVEVGYYVILRYWDVEKQKLVELETRPWADNFLRKLIGKKLIMHNAVFDCAMVWNNFQVDLMPSVHTDTMILGHVLNENRSNGLKERALELFGEEATQEQIEMKESVTKNGGVLNKKQYELYKADAELIAKYGAKDAILTLKLFYNDVPQLYEEGLDSFFYEKESMPLLRGPTYDMNTTGLAVDPSKLQTLKQTLEVECHEAKAFVYAEILPHVQEKYPATNIRNTFNIEAIQQLSWLLFSKLDNTFYGVTKGGRELCKALDMRIPYTVSAKREFVAVCIQRKGEEYMPAKWDPKKKKFGRPKKIGDYWKYLSCGKETLTELSAKYKWCEKLLEYKKNMKLLHTYVEGIQSRMNYNVIRPNFLQHGTTSGRYSCKNPNFQNLPREDKRVKACIIARPNKVFVGADYSQLEPRVFASISGDYRLQRCFTNGDDFYSVIGAEVYGITGLSMKKDEEGSFAKKYPHYRTVAKVVGLASTYGATPARLARELNKSREEAEDIIDNYFESFPQVKEMMLQSHETAKATGVVHNLYGRPRRMPEATAIDKKKAHHELEYTDRNTLNLAVNHRIQSSGASIMNRAAVAVWENCRALEEHNPAWKAVKIVLQVHDELILEGPKELAEEMAIVLKDAMELTTELPGVTLIADPKIGFNLGELK